MKRPRYDIPKIYMQPGELVFSSVPVEVTTVLGSCLAVTMFHLGTQVGAVCHALLPAGVCPKKVSEGCNPGFRFVNGALRVMFMAFESRGISPKEIQIKIFGGGDVLEAVEGRVDPTVGRMNINEAWRCLNEIGVFPRAEDVGGPYGRKLLFFSHTGDVYVKCLKKWHDSLREGELPARSVHSSKKGI
ncbi:MAG: chemotaxis protein CheD [Candidatus Riflebacteria bacterium]|nr:chemotaxis protein CheD [Candidatus Riflebacteria bacterium]